MINKKLPYELNWGVNTTDSYSDKNNIAIHVINHYIENKESIERTIHFITGKLIMFTQHLPTGSEQVVKIDDRGQKITDKERNYIRNILKEFCSSVDFLSEGK